MKFLVLLLILFGLMHVLEANVKPPPKVENGHVCGIGFQSSNGKIASYSATYCCNEGYVPMQSSPLARSSYSPKISRNITDSEWPNPPQCAPRVENAFICSTGMNISNGATTLQLTYCCQGMRAGFRANANSVQITLQKHADGKWPKPPECPKYYLDVPPPKIDNGDGCTTGFSPDSQSVSYCCDMGFNRTGSRRRIVRKITEPFWPYPPQCAPIVRNAYMCATTETPSAENREASYTVKYCCDDGAIMNGTDTITRTMTTKWTRPPRCLGPDQQFADKVTAVIKSGNLTAVEELPLDDVLGYFTVTLDEGAIFGYFAGETFLNVAARYGQNEIAVYLVQKGADVSYTSYHGESPLQLAAANDNLELATFLVNKSIAIIDVPDSSGYTPLLAAANSASVSVVKLLINWGASVNVTDRNGNSALILAGDRGAIEIVSLLLQHGQSNVDLSNKTGDTALIAAAFHGHLDTVRALVKTGHADVNLRNAQDKTALYVACDNNNTKVAEFLLDNGAVVDAQTINESMTPLMIASSKGYAEIASLLLMRGADVTLRNNNSETAFFLAAKTGTKDALLALLPYENGTDEISTDQRLTPLMTAAVNGQLENAKCLLSNGAQVNAGDIRGRTALMFAITFNQTALVEFFVNFKDSDLNALMLAASLINETEGWPQNSDGYSALMLACVKGRVELADMLIKAGASLELGDAKTGRTALSIAAGLNNSLEIVRLLLDAKADVNSRDNNGWTPLISAIEGRQLENAGFLLSRGANINLADHLGDTPLIHASKINDTAAVNILLQQKEILLNARGKDGCTALIAAAQGGYNAIVNALIFAGAAVGTRSTDGSTSALIGAARMARLETIQLLMPLASANDLDEAMLAASKAGHIDATQVLIDNGASVNAKDTSHQQWSALQLAVVRGLDDIIRLLIINGADILVKTPDNSSDPLLTLAIRNELYDIAQILVNGGADVHAKDSQGREAFMWAILKANDTLAQFLLDNEADVNTTDNAGNTALMAATLSNDPETMASFLLDNNSTSSYINVNSTNKNGENVFLFAIRHNATLDFVQFLIKQDIDAKQRSKSGESALLIAVNAGRIDIVTFLLQTHLSDGSERDNDDNSAFLLAAKKGSPDMLTLLRDSRANINRQNKDGNTALMLLAQSGRLDNVLLVLQFHPALNERNAEGNFALGMAASKRRADVVALLITQGADITLRNSNRDTALTLAAAVPRNAQVASLLLQNRIYVQATNNAGNNAIILAAGVGDADVVRLFVSYGADVNSNNSVGDTPLLRAAANGFIPVAKILNDRGANLEASNQKGQTALLVAAKNGRLEMVRYLLSIQASVNVADVNGDTALQLAASAGYFEIVRLLWSQGASVNNVNKYGITPLLAAVNNSAVYIEVTNFLIFHNADVNYRAADDSAESALTLSAENGRNDLVRLLLKHGAEVDIRNGQGRTPLMKAAFAGHFEVAKTLINAKANVLARDADGVTPIVLASWNAHKDIVNLLLANGAQRAGCTLCFFDLN